MKKSQPQLFIIKRNSPLFAALMFWATLTGCGKQIYSHQQVMQSYHTKDEVMRQFDQPDEIIEGGDTTQWIYNCDVTSDFAESRTKVKVNGIYNSSAGITLLPVAVKQFTRYKKFVRFTFDRSGNVLNWDTSGVNFVQRKMKTVHKIGIVLSSLTVVWFIYAAISFQHWRNNL